MSIIRFNKPTVTGEEKKYVLAAIKGVHLSGDGVFTKKCHVWFERELGCKKALLTTSCTHALEMAAILIDIQPGDEVIMPSFTFVSTANAFVLRGARIKFVDIRPDTMNVDESKIEAAITLQTKAIVGVHYAGVSCNMDAIMDIAKRHNVFVIEDAAQAMTSSYKGKQLGTVGHLGAFSFHETKNYTSGGEGGLLIINDDCLVERAEVIREKGTNRTKYLRGMVDKYSWVDIGSSYLPSELNAAFLWGQLGCLERINRARLAAWNLYYAGFKVLADRGDISLPTIPEKCEHNAHMFYIKVKDVSERTRLLRYLKNIEIIAVFHYVPLHTSIAGEKFGSFIGVDEFTSNESDRLLRLPLFHGISDDEVNKVVTGVHSFFVTTPPPHQFSQQKPFELRSRD